MDDCRTMKWISVLECFYTSGWVTGSLPPVENWLLVCWRWWSDWSFARTGVCLSPPSSLAALQSVFDLFRRITKFDVCNTRRNSESASGVAPWRPPPGKLTLKQTLTFFLTLTLTHSLRLTVTDFKGYTSFASPQGRIVVDTSFD